MCWRVICEKKEVSGVDDDYDGLVGTSTAVSSCLLDL